MSFKQAFVTLPNGNVRIKGGWHFGRMYVCSSQEWSFRFVSLRKTQDVKRGWILSLGWLRVWIS